MAATGMWTGPSVLAMILLGELVYLFGSGTVNQVNGISSVNPKEVSIVLLGPYLIGVESAVPRCSCFPAS